MALSRCHRNRVHGANIGQIRPRWSQQTVLDVEDDLSLDQKVVIEGKSILGEVHGSFDRVLDRHHTHVDVILFDGIEDIGNRAKRQEFTSSKVLSRLHRLFGERPEGTEETDATDRGAGAAVSSVGGHGCQGYADRTGNTDPYGMTG